MLLALEGKEIVAHFQHFEDTGDPTRRWDMVTRCILHEERCTEVGCATLIASCASSKPVKVLGVGEARCSLLDCFTKKTGRKIALTRALRPLPQPIRKQIWEAYFKVSPHN